MYVPQRRSGKSSQKRVLLLTLCVDNSAGWHSGLSLCRTLRLQVVRSFVEALSMLCDLEVSMKGLKLQQYTLKRNAWPHSPLGAIEGYLSRST